MVRYSVWMVGEPTLWKRFILALPAVTLPIRYTYRSFTPNRYSIQVGVDQGTRERGKRQTANCTWLVNRGHSRQRKYRLQFHKISTRCCYWRGKHWRHSHSKSHTAGSGVTSSSYGSSRPCGSTNVPHCQSLTRKYCLSLGPVSCC